jgi:hypothetical protein
VRQQKRNCRLISNTKINSNGRIGQDRTGQDRTGQRTGRNKTTQKIKVNLINDDFTAKNNNPPKFLFYERA